MKNINLKGGCLSIIPFCNGVGNRKAKLSNKKKSRAYNLLSSNLEKIFKSMYLKNIIITLDSDIDMVLFMVSINMKLKFKDVNIFLLLNNRDEINNIDSGLCNLIKENVTLIYGNTNNVDKYVSSYINIYLDEDRLELIRRK